MIVFFKKGEQLKLTNLNGRADWHRKAFEGCHEFTLISEEITIDRIESLDEFDCVIQELSSCVPEKEYVKEFLDDSYWEHVVKRFCKEYCNEGVGTEIMCLLPINFLLNNERALTDQGDLKPEFVQDFSLNIYRGVEVDA